MPRSGFESGRRRRTRSRGSGWRIWRPACRHGPPPHCPSRSCCTIKALPSFAVGFKQLPSVLLRTDYSTLGRGAPEYQALFHVHMPCACTRYAELRIGTASAAGTRQRSCIDEAVAIPGTVWSAAPCGVLFSRPRPSLRMGARSSLHACKRPGPHGQPQHCCGRSGRPSPAALSRKMRLRPQGAKPARVLSRQRPLPLPGL